MNEKISQGTCVQIKFRPQDYEILQAVSKSTDQTIVQLIRKATCIYLRLLKHEVIKDSLIAGTFTLDNPFMTIMENKTETNDHITKPSRTIRKTDEIEEALRLLKKDPTPEAPPWEKQGKAREFLRSVLGLNIPSQENLDEP